MENVINSVLLCLITFAYKEEEERLNEMQPSVTSILRGPAADIQMKATENYFPAVLFIMLYKVVLTSESVDKILNCDHSNKSY